VLTLAEAHQARAGAVQHAEASAAQALIAPPAPAAAVPPPGRRQVLLDRVPEGGCPRAASSVLGRPAGRPWAAAPGHRPRPGRAEGHGP